MPHQDTDDLPTPLESLQSLLELISDQQLQDVQRHGNASIRANVLAITALVVFGWTKKDSLTERFQIARDVVQRILPNQTQVRSRQGLFSAFNRTAIGATHNRTQRNETMLAKQYKKLADWGQSPNPIPSTLFC